MGKLFGTDGIRGLPNKDLSPEFVIKIGKAIGTYFGKGSRILVARDVRAGGDMIMRAVESGLLSTGCKVVEGGFVPTPALQYAIKTLGYDGGVMITASHNPPEYNGIKVIGNDGIEIPREEELKIEEIFFNEKFYSEEWSNLIYDIEKDYRIIQTYVKGILEHVDKEIICKRKFKVLIDPANSVGALTTPIIARELCCKIYVINGNLDPLFSSRLPEPTFETLKETSKLAKTLEVQLGIAHDGDADRAIFIDSEGNIQWGDRSGTILALHAKNKSVSSYNYIVTAVSSSSLVEEFLSKFGIEVRWTPVGSVIIAHTLKKEGGIVGFEENGGFIYPPHQLVRDGSMTFALMLEYLAMERISSAEAFSRLPKYYTIKDKIPLNKIKNIESLYQNLINIYGNIGKVITIDGVKIISKDFWFLVRKSGTEPIIRIMVEAKDKNKAEELLREIYNIATGGS